MNRGKDCIVIDDARTRLEFLDDGLKQILEP